MSQIYKRLLHDILAEEGIQEDRLIRLLDALDAADYIDSASIRLTRKIPDIPFALVATYIGKLQIGNSIKKMHVDETVVRNVKGIYRDIGKRSGIKFRTINPFPHDNECIGYPVLSDTNELAFPLVLYKK